MSSSVGSSPSISQASLDAAGRRVVLPIDDWKMDDNNNDDDDDGGVTTKACAVEPIHAVVANEIIWDNFIVVLLVETGLLAT
jgi:hypothetical protein